MCLYIWHSRQLEVWLSWQHVASDTLRRCGGYFTVDAVERGRIACSASLCSGATTCYMEIN